MNAKYGCVLVAVPTISKARHLTGLLISQKLAACVQILPKVESHYRWKKQIVVSREVLLIIKTRTACYPLLEKTIRRHHPYEVPEIVYLPIQRGSKPYLDWVRQETSDFSKVR